ncbi:LysR family transcriptional regulator [Massilia sp. IC2-476]|uniref:LysR family transcriptional regulator n=1 Tax=Massilia sp. IC2-476 TaxID=2887199 RepID=UPI001D108376|nr:LysR family transcriptional regulator [Massilia sp. IC2-476]MCC2974775.1 LysR family transcriptional regulator [Massilia sp. IC2-476]
MSALDAIRLFLAVAEQRSFTQAARSLDISPTAVSKGIRALEKKHGVALFARTTRSVALTEAGQALLAALRPAVGQIDEAFNELAQFSKRPAGHLRLCAPRAFGFLVARVLVPRMRAAYPDISFDLALDDGLVDLVADGYDAGIRLGQSIAQDMVAIRLSRPLAWSVVAAPGYFERHGVPRAPRELLAHRTLRYRFPTSSLLPPWRFAEGDAGFQLDTDATLVANDTRLLAELARQGLGIAYLPDMEIEDDVRDGRLQRVLTGFVPDSSGLFLYFPMRAQNQPKMRALIEQAGLLADEGLLDIVCP